jgi:radical SAM protein with 4Fe4S-binding SPASM domain
LLHHDLPGILARIPDQSWQAKEVEISTNAQFVDWPSFEQAISLGILSQLIVSCDGDGSPEDYERLRPPSRWEKLIEFLDRASAIRDRLSPKLRLYTRTICVDPEAQARWRAIFEPRGWIPEFREWAYLPDSIENMTGRDLRFRTGICSYLKTNHRLYVDWDGTVVPCCIHPRAGEFGNLMNQSFNDILFGERRSEFSVMQRADRKKMLICSSCEL